jgi:hypothetical protein
VYAPGELAYAARERNAGQCRLSPEITKSLIESARKVGVVLDDKLHVTKG